MMANILDEILQQVGSLNQKIADLENRLLTEKQKPLTFTEYCKREGITRPTGYRRSELGIIELQKIGGRQYVIVDSIQTVQKYERL